MAKKNKKLTTAFEDTKKEQKDRLPAATVEQIYTEGERAYRNFLLNRLEFARDQRENNHDELDGMTYTEYYESNTKAATSYITPRSNTEETEIVTGTTREKKLAIMSAIINLNIEPEIKAFDQDDKEAVDVGLVMEDMTRKSEELENWEENKILAYDELTTQGNVFIEELWYVETKWDKKKLKLDSFTEETFKTFKPEKKIKEVFRGCKRNIVPGLFVYLGNIKEFEMRQQPFIFTKEIVPYDMAKAMYGEWPRWKYLDRELRETPPTDSDSTAYGMDWHLTTGIPEGWTEIIKYQDRLNDEYMILVDGIMMLPTECPLPWEYDEYNIVKGNLEPISAKFAYCKSVPAKTKVDQQVLDEMVRLAILKTQKSFLPPIANYSANVLSKTAFLPGKVHNDLVKGEMEVLGGNPNMYAVQQSELAMIELIKKFIDEKSVNPLLQGQTPTGDPTATEILQIQSEAKKRLGLMVFGFMNLHRMLTAVRVFNGIENWTKPIGQKLDSTKKAIVDKYKSYTVQGDTSSGKGEHVIDFTEEHMDPLSLIDMEEGVMRDENGNMTGRKAPAKHTRIFQVNPKALRSIKWTWYFAATPSEKETSLVSQVVLTKAIESAMVIFGPESVNMEYAKQRWAQANKLPASKFFKQGMAAQPPAALQPGQGENPAQQLEPKVPTKELAINGQA